MLDAERKRGCGAFAESQVAGDNDYGNAALRDGCAHGDAQYPRHLLRLRDQLTVMAAILEEMVGTRLLKVAASDLVAWNLRCDRKDRHTIAVAIEQAIDEMKVAGTATARTDGKFSGKVGFSAGSERRYFFMSCVQPFDLALAANHIGETVQAVADDAVNSFYACIHQSLDEDVGYSFCHVSPPPVKPSHVLRYRARHKDRLAISIIASRPPMGRPGTFRGSAHGKRWWPTGSGADSTPEWLSEYQPHLNRLLGNLAQAHQDPALHLYGRQTGMYGPPPCRKRKVRLTSWSAQMYTAFVGAVAPSQYGMAALFSTSVMQSHRTSSRCGFGERRVRPLCHLIVLANALTIAI